jgi:hypothetical protein
MLMGRYVILRHEFATRQSQVHWDFMFEFGDKLRTWALAELPAAGVSIAAEQLPDHRLEYLDYEGSVSGDRGSVSRWDAGQMTILSESPDRLVMRLSGDRLSGEATLQRQSEDASAWGFALRS